jgi:hypothetical protein
VDPSQPVADRPAAVVDLTDEVRLELSSGGHRCQTTPAIALLADVPERSACGPGMRAAAPAVARRAASSTQREDLAMSPRWLDYASTQSHSQAGTPENAYIRRRTVSVVAYGVVVAAVAATTLMATGGAAHADPAPAQPVQVRAHGPITTDGTWHQWGSLQMPPGTIVEARGGNRAHQR